MANSRIGQYRMEFELAGFSSPARVHLVGLWVAPTATPTVGSLPTAINLQLLGGGSATLQAVANAFLGVLKPMYAASVTMGAFTLWRMATEYQKDFVSAGTATTAAIGSGVVNVANQKTLTFRHANGGIGKVVLLESNQGVNTKTTMVINAAGTPVQKLAAYLMSTASPMIALDNSFPVAGLYDSGGENEKLFRKIYRS